MCYSSHNNLDDFLHCFYDTIIILYQLIIERTNNNSPYFLSNFKPYQLIHYIYDICELQIKEFAYKNNYILSCFRKVYTTEIETSYNDVNNFTKLYFKCSIPYQNWEAFCCTHSNLYELKREIYKSF